MTWLLIGICAPLYTAIGHAIASGCDAKEQGGKAAHAGVMLLWPAWVLMRVGVLVGEVLK